MASSSLSSLWQGCGGSFLCAGSFLTLQNNAAELLKGCGMKVPSPQKPEQYLEAGPAFLVWLHPALGPLWNVTQQKIQVRRRSMPSRGTFAKYAYS